MALLCIALLAADAAMLAALGRPTDPEMMPTLAALIVLALAFALAVLSASIQSDRSAEPSPDAIDPPVRRRTGPRSFGGPRDRRAV